MTGKQITGEIFHVDIGNDSVVLDDPFGIEIVKTELRDGDVTAIE
jgi:hypothetical protein